MERKKMEIKKEKGIGEMIATVAEHKGILEPNSDSYVSLVDILALAVAGSVLRRVVEVIAQEKRRGNE
jgi:hypothetical protein